MNLLQNRQAAKLSLAKAAKAFNISKAALEQLENSVDVHADTVKDMEAYYFLYNYLKLRFRKKPDSLVDLAQVIGNATYAVYAEADLKYLESYLVKCSSSKYSVEDKDSLLSALSASQPIYLFVNKNNEVCLSSTAPSSNALHLSKLLNSFNIHFNN